MPIVLGAGAAVLFFFPELGMTAAVTFIILLGVGVTLISMGYENKRVPPMQSDFSSPGGSEYIDEAEYQRKNRIRRAGLCQGESAKKSWDGPKVRFSRAINPMRRGSVQGMGKIGNFRG